MKKEKCIVSNFNDFNFIGVAMSNEQYLSRGPQQIKKNKV